MKTLIFALLIGLVTLNSVAQKDVAELFETDRFDIPKEYENVDLTKKLYLKVTEDPTTYELTVFLSNNQVLLDSYFVDGNSFKGGVGIYEEDFVLRMKLNVNEPTGKEREFLPLRYEDGNSDVHLFYRGKNGFIEDEIKVADGFVLSKQKTEDQLNYEFALLLNRFYSIKCTFSKTVSSDNNVSIKEG